MLAIEKVEVITPVIVTRALIVGGDGLLGSACGEVLNWKYKTIKTERTSRRNGRHIQYDLEWGDPDVLPPADVVFLCAAITGFRECEGNRRAWQVNVDGVLRVALRYPFCVYPSTQAVEWSANQYARQAAQVEAVLLATRSAAIVRCGRVTSDTALQCAAKLVHCGLDKTPGIYHWPEVQL